MYRSHESAVIVELPDDGRCKHAIPLGSCAADPVARYAIVCNREVGHPKSEANALYDGSPPTDGHMIADATSFDLPGHEYHRLVVDRSADESPASHPYWQRCSCGDRIMFHGSCDHVKTRGPSSYAPTEEGFLITFADGCTERVTIEKAK